MLGQPACHPGKSVHNIKYGTVLGSSIFHPRDIVPREEVPVLRRRQRGTKREATFNRIRRPESSSTLFQSQPSVSSRLLLWALLLMPGNDSLTGRFLCPSFLLPLSDCGRETTIGRASSKEMAPSVCSGIAFYQSHPLVLRLRLCPPTGQEQ